MVGVQEVARHDVLPLILRHIILPINLPHFALHRIPLVIPFFRVKIWIVRNRRKHSLQGLPRGPDIFRIGWMRLDFLDDFLEMIFGSFIFEGIVQQAQRGILQRTLHNPGSALKPEKNILGYH